MAPNDAPLPAKSADPMVDTNKASPSIQGSTTIRDAEAKVIEAEAKAIDAAKSPEQRNVDEARAEADIARRKAALDADLAAAPPERMTVAEAKIMAPVPDDMGAGDHMAQAFRNDPENPRTYRGEHDEPEKQTVRLRMIAPDHETGFVTTLCHPEMTGDYVRAGWEVY